MGGADSSRWGAHYKRRVALEDCWMTSTSKLKGKGLHGALLDDQSEAVAVAETVAVAVPEGVDGVTAGTVFSTVVSMVFSTVTVRGGAA